MSSPSRGTNNGWGKHGTKRAPAMGKGPSVRRRLVGPNKSQWATASTSKRMSVMVEFRWWLFKLLSAIGWWVCPEPHKSRLTKVMPTWKEVSDGHRSQRG